MLSRTGGGLTENDYAGIDNSIRYVLKYGGLDVRRLLAVHTDMRVRYPPNPIRRWTLPLSSFTLSLLSFSSLPCGTLAVVRPNSLVPCGTCGTLTFVQVDYAWSGRRSWGEFPPPRLTFNSPHDHPTKFALSTVVRRPGQYSKFLDSTTEQAHSRVPHIRHVPFHKARKSRLVTLP